MNLTKLLNEPSLLHQALNRVYVNESSQYDRYHHSLLQFKKIFDQDDVLICSTPGRVELCGNHTDHQLGKILAASIDIDSLAITSKADSIRIYSKGFEMIELDVDDDLYLESERYTTRALVKGVIKRFKELNLFIGGFNAYITSDVLPGSGMSSSANFEVLLATILNHLFNDGQIDAIKIAQIAQYAEVHYFGKPCGLMDQLACVYGGIIYVDFEDENSPKVIKLDDIFHKHGYVLSLIDTRSTHDDLSDEYTKIVDEMKEVAKYFSKPVLSKLDVDHFYNSISELSRLDNDRAILRSHHYFSEINRVTKLFDAIANDDISLILELIKQSGYSSFMYLQNIYLSNKPNDQKLAIVLAMVERYLSDSLSAFRIHGGGFGGTILAITNEKTNEKFKEFIGDFIDIDVCKTTNIRNNGSICILK